MRAEINAQATLWAPNSWAAKLRARQREVAAAIPDSHCATSAACANGVSPQRCEFPAQEHPLRRRPAWIHGKRRVVRYSCVSVTPGHTFSRKQQDYPGEQVSNTRTIGRITVAIGAGIAAVAISLTTHDNASAIPQCQDNADCQPPPPTTTRSTTTTHTTTLPPPPPTTSPATPPQFPACQWPDHPCAEGAVFVTR